MGLALVMIEEDAGRTVHLRDDDPLGSVDDEGSGMGHEGNFAQVDVLLLDLLHGLGAGLLILLPDDEAEGDLQGGRKGHAPLQTLVHLIFRLAQ